MTDIRFRIEQVAICLQKYFLANEMLEIMIEKYFLISSISLVKKYFCKRIATCSILNMIPVIFGK